MAGTTGIVQGRDCIFQVNIGAGYVPVVCSKSFAVTTETEMKETTTVGSGVWKEFDYKSLSYSISLNGAVKVTDADSDAIYFDLLYYQMNFLELPFKAIFTDPDDNVKVIRGRAIVPRSVFNASPGQLADSVIDLQGSGEMFLMDTVDLCELVVTDFSDTFIAPGEGGNNSYEMTVVMTGDPGDLLKFEYSIDGSGRLSGYGNPFPFTATSGDHEFTVWPVCNNGLDGTEFTQTLTLA